MTVVEVVELEAMTAEALTHLLQQARRREAGRDERRALYVALLDERGGRWPALGAFIGKRR